MRILEVLGLADTHSGELKFWVHPGRGEWILHDLDDHHVKIAATDPDRMGIPRSEIIDNPYVAGSANRFGDPDDDESLWSVEDADNDDRVARAAMRRGWVRGGHIVDLMAYHEYGEIDHEGGVYLEGLEPMGLRRAARMVMQRWPELEYLRIEQTSADGASRTSFDLEGAAIDAFIRRGIRPR